MTNEKIQTIITPEKKALLLYNGPGAFAFLEWGKGKFEVPAGNLERTLIDGKKSLVQWVHDKITLEEVEKRLREIEYGAIILGRKQNGLFDPYEQKAVWYHPPLGLFPKQISGDKSEGDTILRMIRNGDCGKLNQNVIVYAVDDEYEANRWISRKNLMEVLDLCPPSRKEDFEEGGKFNGLIKSLR